MSASQIGPYQIKNTLRHDREYALFAAYDPRIREDVILKLWRKEHVSRSFANRMQQEAQIINSLSHPAIVPIWGFGDLGGNPYLATLEMSGGTLNERIKNGPFSPSETEQLFTRLAQAVEALHERDIVHGHVQPQHIFFDKKGQIYLAWLASRTNDVDFASPEQAAGQLLTPASDIFSLGILLLYLVTGKTLETVAAEDIPEPFLPVLDRALYEKPQDRFATVRDMITALKSPPKQKFDPMTDDDAFAAWGAVEGGAAAAAIVSPTADDDDPFAEWGLDSTATSQTFDYLTEEDDDPFAAFAAAAPLLEPPIPSTKPKPPTDPDDDMMALFMMEEEEEPPPVEEPAAKPPARQFVYDPGPGDPLDEPFPNWLDDELNSPGDETLLPRLDQFLPTNDKTRSSAEGHGYTRTRPRRRSLDPQTRRYLLFGGITFILLLCLIPLAILVLPDLLTSQETFEVIPTIPPAATETPTPDPNLPTPTPTPTPSILINSPLPDSQIEQGEPISLNITITDPIGLRSINLFADGVAIGSYDGRGQMMYTIEQQWIPDVPGTRSITVVATNRAGTTFDTQILVQVQQRPDDGIEE